MAYATLTRVQGLIAAVTIDGTSVPNQTQAEQMISDISDEIDTVLGGLGYTVPVAIPSWFLNRLALLNCYGGAAMILKSAYPEASGPGENPAYAFWEARYQAGLKALRSGEDTPPEIVDTADESGQLPSGYFTRNPSEEETLGDLAGASMFKTGTTF